MQKPEPRTAGLKHTKIGHGDKVIVNFSSHSFILPCIILLMKAAEFMQSKRRATKITVVYFY